jgi:3-deoxy-7-phosphoheptulonate synthase
MPGAQRTAIGITGNQGALEAAEFEVLPGVAEALRVSKPYKLVSREVKSEDSIIALKTGPGKAEVSIGGRELAIIAGPCAIESREQLFEAARAVRENGGKLLRGGAYKPRTSPYSFQGLGVEGLKLLKEAGERFGLVTVTEIIDQHDLDAVAEHADILQVGARNMQNYPLLTTIGRSAHPVVIKRGPSATIDEWLLAAEYVLAQGNSSVILCERGVHPLDREHTRYTLDLSAVPVAKLLSHLPVIVDPSHASGNWRYVAAMSKAAVAAGADGLLMEIHPDPSCALCDGVQSLRLESFASLMDELRAVASAVGRTLAA